MRTPPWSVLAALALVGLLSAPARAQWIPGGTVVGSNVDTYLNDVAVVPDGKAGALVLAAEVGASGFKHQVERVGPDGSFPAGWPSTALEASFVTHGLAADGNGGAYVGRKSQGPTGSQVVVFHLLANGSLDPTWPATGRIVADFFAQQGVDLASDGAGGVYVVRSVLSDSSQLFVQRLDASGATHTGWPEEGVRIAQATGTRIILFGDLKSSPAGLYLTGYFSLPPDYFVPLYTFIGHITPSGSIPAGWGTGTVAFPWLPDGYEPPPYTPDTAGGIFYSWQAGRVGRLVHLLADASPDPAWPVRGLALLADTTHYQFLYQPVSDGAGGCFARFAYDSAATNLVVVPRLVHVTASATAAPGWPTLGAHLPYAFNGYDNGNIVADGNGGAYASWFEENKSVPGHEGFGFLRVHHVGAGGVTAPYWPETGLTLASGPGSRFADRAHMVTDAHGGAIAVWAATGTDTASPDDSTEMLALGFGPDGSFTTSVGGAHAATMSALRASPVPARDVTNLAFSLARTTSVRVEVLDVNGRRIRRLVAGTLAPGPHSVAWDGRDDAGRSVAPGVYMARAEGAGVTSAARMVRIR